MMLFVSAQGSIHAQTQKLILGIHETPPMTFSHEGEFRGFIVDILRDFARKNGYKLEFRKADFFQLLEMIHSGDIDVMAPLAYTLKRARGIHYSSESLITSWSHIILPSDSSVNTLFDLNAHSMGVIRGDFSYALLRKDLEQNGIRIRFVEFSKFEQIFHALREGRIDSGFMSRFFIQNRLWNLGKYSHLKLLPQSFYPANLYFGVNKKLSELHDRLDIYLRNSRENPDSALNKAKQYWFSPISDRRNFFFRPGFLISLAAILIILGIVGGFNILLRRRVHLSTLEINRRRRYFQDLLQSIPVGIVILDEKHRVVDVNREFEKMFGFSREVLLGDPLNNWIRAPEDAEDTRKFVMKTRMGTREVSESQRLTREGKMLTVQIVSTPTILSRDSSGSIRIYIDLTEKNLLEQEIIKAKNIESLGLLAGGIAHDFNNLLTGITGNLSLALQLTDDPHLTEILNKAEKAADKSRELTRQLLTFSKGGSPVKQVVDLIPIIHDTLDINLSDENRITLKLDLPRQLPLLSVDPAQISQVISNLVINARQSMPSGGTLAVKTEIREITDSTESVLPGRYVVLSIRDTGCGIPAASMDKIFTPYFSSKSGGSGLGLAICYSIMRKHMGHIHATSSLGKGTEFTVFLPLTAKKQGIHPLTGAVPEGYRILIMDDDPGIREFFKDIRRVFNLQIDTTSGYSETLTRFRSALATETPYSAVFLDLVIPGGSGGIETLTALRRHVGNLPAVAMSGYSDNAVFSTPEAYGFQELLPKPFGIEDLAQVLRRLFPPDSQPGTVEL